MKPDPQSLGRVQGVAQLRGVAGVRRIREDGDTGERGDDLLEDLELFGDELAAIMDSPVIFASGRARLTTNPVAIASPAFVMTIGMVLVARFAA